MPVLFTPIWGIYLVGITLAKCWQILGISKYFYWTLWDLKEVRHINKEPIKISIIAFIYRVKRVVAEEGLEPPTRGL